MKANRKIIFFLALFVPLAWLGCQKEDPLPEPTPVAGKGGHATLKVIPQFDGVDVDSCMIYIIYNSLDNVEIFDDSLAVKRIEDGRPFAEFKGLQPGDYYIYGKGWDIKRSLPVSGGIAQTIVEPYAYRTLELQVRN